MKNRILTIIGRFLNPQMGETCSIFNFRRRNSFLELKRVLELQGFHSSVSQW